MPTAVLRYCQSVHSLWSALWYNSTFGIVIHIQLTHLRTYSTICVNLDKVAAVRTWPAPTCVKEVQQVLSLANYYHEYTKNFAELAAFLSDH